MSRLVALLALVALTVSCSTETIEAPAFAAGISGPAVLDEAGLVAAWELLGGPDNELPDRPARYMGDFGIDATTPASTEITVVWQALPCQLEPVARVSSRDGGVHIEVNPGPNPIEHCAAMSIGYGFRLSLAAALGDNVVTAQLIDPVNQQLLVYPQR